MRNKILKFRAWDGLNKKFTYWTMNDLCTYAEKDEKPSALDDWQQDTSLLDRHGKEIYEGDILNYARRDFEGGVNVIVGWSGSGFYVGYGHHIPITEILKMKSEIIGNIWENPELLHTQI